MIFFFCRCLYLINAATCTTVKKISKRRSHDKVIKRHWRDLLSPKDFFQSFVLNVNIECLHCSSIILLIFFYHFLNMNITTAQLLILDHSFSFLQFQFNLEWLILYCAFPAQCDWWIISLLTFFHLLIFVIQVSSSL